MNLLNQGSPLQLAIQAGAAGDTARALTLLQDEASRDPSSGVPYFLMGAQLAQSGQYESAEAAYANALARSPDLVVARFQLGLLQLSSGRAALSWLTWQPLLTLPPTDPLYHYVLGYIALSQDRFDAARLHFHAGLSLAQTNPALAQDVEKTLSAIDAGVKGLGTSDQDGTPDEAGVADSHFLLSNYRSEQGDS